MPKNEWRCRWSPTLGKLEDTAENVWGIERYNKYGHEEDAIKSVVFFGLYGLPDFYALWRHKGRKAILWAGTDILYFKKGYWLDDGKINLNPKALAQWINRYCESWCENEVECEVLRKLGIYAKICPSFLGDVSKFQVSFKPGNKLYTSVSGDNYKQYGWDKIAELAHFNPDIEFHLYGNQRSYLSTFENVIVHGRIPKEQMNEEIKDMQGALRLTKFDGFSEILAKSILMGQWPVSLIKYPHMLTLGEIKLITKMDAPNLAGKKYYLEKLNQYPWNKE